MSKSIRYGLTITCVLVVELFATAPSHANVFLDWLWGRSPYYRSQGQPTAYAYPYNMAPAGVAPAGVVPTTAYRAMPPGNTIRYALPASNAPAVGTAVNRVPATGVPLASTTAMSGPRTNPHVAVVAGTAAATVAGNSAGCSTCSPVAAAQPVYQPYVASYLPRTQYRSTWMRVPVISYRPVVAASPVATQQVAQLQPCYTYRWQLQRVPVSAYRPIYSGWSGCWGRRTTLFGQPAATVECPPVTYPAAVPAVATPAPTTSPYYVPGTASPSPLQPSPLTPIPATPAPAGGVPSGVPANQIPRLDAVPMQPQLQGSSAYPPSSDSRLMDRVDAPSGTANPSSTPRRFYNVRPVPDAKANQPSQPGADGVPQLLQSRDRTANAGRRAWMVAPISWPGPPPAAAPVAPQPDNSWDDRGWRSAR